MACALLTLIKTGVLKPGKGVLTRDYLGTHYTADLLSDGKILWRDQNAKDNICNTPSAFSTTVLRFVRVADKKLKSTSNRTNRQYACNYVCVYRYKQRHALLSGSSLSLQTHPCTVSPVYTTTLYIKKHATSS